MKRRAWGCSKIVTDRDALRVTALGRGLASSLTLPALAIIAATAILIALLNQHTRVELPQPHATAALVERIVADSRQPPAADDPRWQRVDLPDRAPLVANSETQRAWYRLRFQLTQRPQALQALLLRRPVSALLIHVNGEQLADSGVSRRPLPVYRSDLRYNLPPALWQGGSLEVLVLSVSQQGRAGLGQVLVADSNQLAQYKSVRNHIEKTAPFYSLLVTSILAVAFAAVWLARPREVAFGWLALALAARASFTGLGMQQTPLFDWPALYRCLIYLTLLAFVYCELRFSRALLLQPAGVTERRIGATLLAIAATVLTLSLVAAQSYLLVGVLVAVPAALFTGSIVVIRFARHCRAHPQSHEVRWLLILAGILLLIGARDWLYDLSLVGPAGSGRYQHYVTPFAFAVFGAMLLRRHVNALDTAEAMNRHLEAKVEEKTAEIARNWRHVAAIERERARFEERDRLMRDMHDGVGGHLVQALAMLQSEPASDRLRESIQSGLDDLRLLIDASDIHAESLSDALARFRERFERRLAALGIRLHWDFTAMPELPRLAPDRTVQVLRILQELLTNVLKHAQARQVDIECQALKASDHDHASHLLIDLYDDGVGFDASQATAGRGLSGLQQRARALGGQLSIDSRPGHGCRTRLVFPVLDSEA